jgi:hypothetical protein
MNKQFKTLILTLLLTLALVSATYQKDATNCETTYQSQNCVVGQTSCAWYSSTLYCQLPATTNGFIPAGSSNTNSASYDASLGGGYVYNCLYTGNSNCNTWFCQYDASCYATKRQTTCTGGATTFTCSATCVTGYQQCDGSTTDGNGCEVQTDVSNCNLGANNNIDSGCACVCDTGWVDYDTGGTNATNGCEIYSGEACTLTAGGIAGVCSSSGLATGTADSSGLPCACIPNKSYFETGTLRYYKTNSTDNPLLSGIDLDGENHLLFLLSNSATNRNFTIDNWSRVWGYEANFSILNVTDLWVTGTSHLGSIIIQADTINGALINATIGNFSNIYSNSGNFSGNITIGHSSDTDDDYIFFDKGINHFKWNDVTQQFDTSNEMHVGGYLNITDAWGDSGYQRIYFSDANSYIRHDTSPNQFYIPNQIQINNNLIVENNITQSSGQYTTLSSTLISGSNGLTINDNDGVSMDTNVTLGDANEGGAIRSNSDLGVFSGGTMTIANEQPNRNINFYTDINGSFIFYPSGNTSSYMQLKNFYNAGEGMTWVTNKDMYFNTGSAYATYFGSVVTSSRVELPDATLTICDGGCPATYSEDGMLLVERNITLYNGEMYINTALGSDADRINFDGNGVYEIFEWTNTGSLANEGYFNLTDDIWIQGNISGRGKTYIDLGNIRTDDISMSDDLYIGEISTTDDDYLFFDGSSEYLMWDETNGEFLFTDDIDTTNGVKMTGDITITGGDMLNENLRFGTSTGSGYWEFEDGGVCIGQGGCTAPDADGQLYVEGNITSTEDMIIGGNQQLYLGGTDVYLSDDAGNLGLYAQGPVYIQGDIDNTTTASIGFYGQTKLRGSVASDGGLVWGSSSSHGVGSITAHNVWANSTKLTDYVFDKYYDGSVKPTDKYAPKDFTIVPLDNLSTYTAEHHHLPTINGNDDWKGGEVELGNITSQIWRSVEVNALYIQELHQTNKEQQAEIDLLKSENKQIKDALCKISPELELCKEVINLG